MMFYTALVWNSLVAQHSAALLYRALLLLLTFAILNLGLLKAIGFHRAFH